MLTSPGLACTAKIWKMQCLHCRWTGFSLIKYSPCPILPNSPVKTFSLSLISPPNHIAVQVLDLQMNMSPPNHIILANFWIWLAGGALLRLTTWKWQQGSKLEKWQQGSKFKFKLIQIRVSNIQWSVHLVYMSWMCYLGYQIYNLKFS